MVKQVASVIVLGIVVVLLGGLAIAPAAAQAPQLPPTIVRFESSADSVILADVEAGTQQVTLTWQTVGLRSEHRVLLYAYRLDAWTLLSATGALPLPVAGSQDVTVQHPHTFGSPSFKLMVVDAQSRVQTQQTLVLPYREVGDSQPMIERFDVEAPVLDASVLAQGELRLPVTWAVLDRWPESNLVFEQVLPDGTVVPVELPRRTLWIPSEGTGLVLPVLPAEGGSVVLRLRVVDMVTGAVLDEQVLDPLPVTGQAAPEDAQQVPKQMGEPLAIKVFEVLPRSVARGGTVTLNWQVTGASRISVWQLDPAGDLALAAPSSSPSGSWTLTLDPAYTGSAGFVLFASDPAGNQEQRSVTVKVQCGMLYFFGADSQGGCPAGDARTVQASFQEYEGGMMLLRADVGEIFVLHASGQVGRYRDTWQGEAISVNATPPNNLIPPQRAFGKVWSENQVVRLQLGWAVKPERSYTMRFQRALDGRLYVTLPDASVIFMTDSAWDYERRMQ